MACDTLFEINDLCFGYSGVSVLDGISLVIPEGGFTGIMGPNGCGKSTLLDLMIRNKVPGSGTIKFCGHDIRHYPKKKLARKIALVPQEYSIDFPFTAREVVLMGRHPHIPRFASPSDRDHEIVEQVMELLGVSSFAGRYFTELSGGEKQRVVFARALAQQTPVLLLDEATSNMDIRHAMEVLEIACRWAGNGRKTVIAVFHDLNLAAAYCDSLIFMKSGRVICHGAIDDILTGQNIYKVFGIHTRVYFDGYSMARQVVFKRGRA